MFFGKILKSSYTLETTLTHKILHYFSFKPLLKNIGCIQKILFCRWLYCL